MCEVAVAKTPSMYQVPAPDPSSVRKMPGVETPSICEVPAAARPSVREVPVLDTPPVRDVATAMTPYTRELAAEGNGEVSEKAHGSVAVRPLPVAIMFSISFRTNRYTCHSLRCVAPNRL